MNPNGNTGTGAAAGDIVIRDVADGDMEAVREIYSHHVLEGLASFEEVPPDVAEMTRRRDALLEQGYPYRVAVQDGRVKGYAYASSYRPRPAYRHTVENSVYVDVNTHRQGIGRKLLEDLIEKCTAMEYRRMVAIIGDSANQPSIELHAEQGFEVAGTLPSVGFKFGRWVDSVIMQRPLGDGDETLPDG
ncbi:MAG: GNAT family N-acetyltransferase [Rhodospirillaceae bacterium]|jgi:phosphinothricin acetyltransferase|nr:GNAT family N-acetyltransferase [Rhodospirillaceae bacterium]|tara:strand:- start:422 stop:988 length:567 start_codon:yes stop_codon:yes gene_type:complete